MFVKSKVISFSMTAYKFLLFVSGIARRPPQHIMEQLRTLNDSLKIGQMLCRSRNPDFLLDIIQRQVGQFLHHCNVFGMNAFYEM